MNKVILMGRLTKDPDTRYTQTGSCVVTFTLAVDRPMSREKKEQAQNNGGQTADFIRCQAFGRTAEMIDKYFSKGRKILIDGHIQTGSYEGKDGRTVYTTDVVINRFEYPESAQQGNNQNGGGYQQNRYQQNYQQQGNYQQQPQQQNYQQMNMNDEIPSGYMEIDESDIPW